MAEYVDPAHIDPHPAPTPEGGRHRLAEDGQRPSYEELLAVYGPLPGELVEDPDGPALVPVAEWDDPPTDPPSLTATGRSGHVAAVLAAVCSVGLTIAQGLVAAPDATLAGLSEPLSGIVLGVAQLVVVLAAAYRVSPGQSK